MVRLRGLLGGETGSKPGPASLSLPREGHQQPEPARAALNDGTSPPMKELYVLYTKYIKIPILGKSGHLSSLMPELLLMIQHCPPI